MELVPPESFFVSPEDKLWNGQVRNPMLVYELLFKTVS